jgi:hypothetical protein
MAKREIGGTVGRLTGRFLADEILDACAIINGATRKALRDNIASAIDEEHRESFADGLEEAAKLCESDDVICSSPCELGCSCHDCEEGRKRCAAAIRQLAEKGE